jgi:hypothetical protein
MHSNSLERFAAETHADWPPISTSTVEKTRQRLEQLMAADRPEDWRQSLHEERPATRELLRDAEHGFVLLAHTEHEGLYRRPHDHGRAWVVYGVEQGELEIGTYVDIPADDGVSRLVRRDFTVLRAGEARAYLPGDIHDTRCTSETALLFRFTERDLRHEDQVEHRVTRYVERNGEWTADRP